jgi:hypothetical protein
MDSTLRCRGAQLHRAKRPADAVKYVVGAGRTDAIHCPLEASARGGLWKLFGKPQTAWKLPDRAVPENTEMPFCSTNRQARIAEIASALMVRTGSPFEPDRGLPRVSGRRLGVTAGGTACHKVGPELARVDPPTSPCARLGSGPFPQLMPGKRLVQRRGGIRTPDGPEGPYRSRPVRLAAEHRGFRRV